MEIENIKNFIGGWFIGDFEPTLLKTKDFEIAVKRYKPGAEEVSHVHKIATEYTVILHGAATFNNQTFFADEIVIVKPGESVAFKAWSDVITLVIKVPSVKGDKYETSE